MLNRSDENITVPASSGFYAMGWFALAFTFPILSVYLGYGYVVTGILGSIIGLPFAIVSFLLRRSDLKRILAVVRFCTIAMVPVTLVFAVLYGSLFFPLLIISDFVTGTFWIGMEIYIGYAGMEGLAERYSSAWGIPNLISPILAGFLLSYLGFSYLFVFSFMFFLIAALFIPAGNARQRDFSAGTLASPLMVLPLLFVGISSGFLYYVIVPFLKLLSYRAYDIGIIVSIPPLVSAVTFIAMNRLKSSNWQAYAIASSLLLSVPLFLAFSSSLEAIIILSSISAVGSSIAFSKLLAYISATSSPGTGVFYYEALFGTGFTVGSLLGGIGFGMIHFQIALWLFLPGILFAIVLSLALFLTRIRGQSRFSPG